MTRYYFPPTKRSYFFIKEGQLLNKVSLKDIDWIEIDGNYATIHAKKNKYLVKSSLKKLIALLPSSLFYQIHRSYIVQLDSVTQIDLTALRVYLGDKVNLPLGRKYKETFLDQIITI